MAPFRVSATPIGMGGRRREVMSVGPMAQKLLQRGHEEDLEAVQAGSGGLMRTLQAEREYQLFEDAARREQMRQEAYQRVAEERQLQLDSMREGFEQKAKELGESHMDPDRLWKNKPLWNKIATGVSLVLGGLASGLAKQENQALKVWQHQIDRDIEAQKFDYQAKLHSADATKSAFYEAMNAYKTREVAEGVARAAAYKHLEDMVSAEAIRRGDNEARARADALTHQIRGEYDRQLAALLRMVQSGPMYALTVNGQTMPVPATTADVKDAFKHFAAQPTVDTVKGVALEGAKGQAVRIPQVRKDMVDNLAKENLLPAMDLVDRTVAALNATTSDPGNAEKAFDAVVGDALGPGKEVLRGALFGEDVKKREQQWKLFVGDYLISKGGKALTETEVKNTLDNAVSANKTEDKLRFLKSAQTMLQSKANQFGAADPDIYNEVKTRYRRLQGETAPAATGAPRGFVPKGP